MKRFWQIISLVLLALMVPASVCCWVPINECQACDCRGVSEQHDGTPVLPDACPSNTIAHSQMPAVAAMPQMQMVELFGSSF